MPDPELSELVSSRICHDLANPIGAVGNGVELLAMTSGSTPEMELIIDALAQTNARMNLFRIAFGAAQNDQMIGAKQAKAIVDALSRGGRHQIAWDLDDQPRPTAKRVFLGLLALESALPFGGDIHISAGPTLTGTGRRVDTPPELWGPVQLGQIPNDLTGAQVHFGMLAQDCASAGITPTLSATETQISLRL